MTHSPARVFIVCPGIGHIRRGFESFSKELGEALEGSDAIDATVLGGGGSSSSDYRRVLCLKRERAFTEGIASLFDRDGYSMEQATFVLGMIPEILLRKPHVIFFSDGLVGNLLWRVRKGLRLRYSLLFSNGGPFEGVYPRFDHVQQLTPTALENGIRDGVSAKRQTLLPYGFKIHRDPEILSVEERRSLRSRLGLPEDLPVILSVGVVNRTHKRMDHLVNELQKLPKPRPYLVILGERDAESLGVEHEAVRSLSSEGVSVRTVAPEETDGYYRVADLFVLCSLHEGFGRVFVEALARGTRSIAHDSPVLRYVLGDAGEFVSMENAGALAECVKASMAVTDDDARRVARHRSVYERFSWDRLKEKYVDLLSRVKWDFRPTNHDW